MDIKHYNQEPKRKAEFFNPPNKLKEKVGTGGLSEEILMRAQSILDNHNEDFSPLAEDYLQDMQNGIDQARSIKSYDDSNNEEIISHILIPCVQLKSNGTMFHYPLITRIASRFIEFMEVVEGIDNKVLEIAEAFQYTIKLILSEKIKDDGGAQGNALVEELNSACMRYFDKKNN